MRFATNRFKTELKDIERYYDIFALKKSVHSKIENEYGNYIKRANTLSKEHEQKLLSLVIRNHMLYLLFKKDEVSKESLEDYILDYEIEYFPNMLYTHKLELIINSLNKYKYPNKPNIIGKVYRLSRSSIYLEYDFYNNLMLAKVSTFTKLRNKKDIEYYRNLNRTLYKIIGDTVIYEPYNIDEYKDIYINKKIYKNQSNKKNTVPFFSIKSFESFQSSKIGVLTDLLLDIEKYLSHCLTITPIFSEYNEINWKKTKAMHIELIHTLNQISFNIIDTTNSKNTSQELKSLLVHAFRENNINENNINISYMIDKNAINLNIVHPADYYKENNIKDTYIYSTQFAIQNIYIENIKKEWENKKVSISQDKVCYSNIANKLLIEGLMKYEIINHVSMLERCYGISIPNWKFLYRYSYNKNKKEKIYKYFQLQIEDGNLDIQELPAIKYEILFKNSSYNYAIIDEKGNLMEIYETKESPIPDYKFIYKRFQECESIDFIDKVELLHHIDLFEKEQSQNISEKQINSFMEKSFLFKITIKNLQEKRPSRETVLKCIPKDINGYKYFGKFIEYYYKKTGIRLAPLLKKAEDVKVYIAGMYKINYQSFYDNSGIPTIRYVVGKTRDSEFNQTLATGMLFRVIKNCDEENFKRYATMLAVDFIRLNQYTVIPYPFKYLREYAYNYMKSKRINLD